MRETAKSEILIFFATVKANLDQCLVLLIVIFEALIVVGNCQRICKQTVFTFLNVLLTFFYHRILGFVLIALWTVSILSIGICATAWKCGLYKGVAVQNREKKGRGLLFRLCQLLYEIIVVVGAASSRRTLRAVDDVAVIVVVASSLSSSCAVSNRETFCMQSMSSSLLLLSAQLRVGKYLHAVVVVV